MKNVLTLIVASAIVLSGSAFAQDKMGKMDKKPMMSHKGHMMSKKGHMMKGHMMKGHMMKSHMAKGHMMKKGMMDKKGSMMKKAN
jgi:pentapeptide MXKDX repeat protein